MWIDFLLYWKLHYKFVWIFLVNLLILQGSIKIITSNLLHLYSEKKEIQPANSKQQWLFLFKHTKISVSGNPTFCRSSFKLDLSNQSLFTFALDSRRVISQIFKFSYFSTKCCTFCFLTSKEACWTHLGPCCAINNTHCLAQTQRLLWVVISII